MLSGFSSIWDECSRQDDASRTRQHACFMPEKHMPDSVGPRGKTARLSRLSHLEDFPGMSVWKDMDPGGPGGGRGRGGRLQVEDTVCAQTQTLAGTVQQKSVRVKDSSGPRGPAGHAHYGTGVPGSQSTREKEGLLPPVEAHARAPPAKVQQCAMETSSFSPGLGSRDSCAAGTQEGILGDEQKDTWILGRLDQC